MTNRWVTNLHDLAASDDLDDFIRFESKRLYESLTHASKEWEAVVNSCENLLPEARVVRKVERIVGRFW